MAESCQVHLSDPRTKFSLQFAVSLKSKHLNSYFLLTEMYTPILTWERTDLRLAVGLSCFHAFGHYPQIKGIHLPLWPFYVYLGSSCPHVIFKKYIHLKGMLMSFKWTVGISWYVNSHCLVISPFIFIMVVPCETQNLFIRCRIISPFTKKGRGLYKLYLFNAKTSSDFNQTLNTDRSKWEGVEFFKNHNPLIFVRLFLLTNKVI